jgi:hypothetical protein
VDVEVDVSRASLPKTMLVGLPEAAVVEELEVIPVSSLAEAAAFFAGHLDIDPTPSRPQELFNQATASDRLACFPLAAHRTSGTAGCGGKPPLCPATNGPWQFSKAAGRSHPHRSFRIPRCAARSRRAPQRRRSTDPLFRQAAQVHLPQTADWQQVGTGPHAADLTFPTACSPARSADSPSPDPRSHSWPCVFWNSHATVLGMASEVPDAEPRTPQMDHPNASQRTPMQGARLAAINRRG